MLNKAILMGRLTKDPELKQTPQGVSVCSFTVAVDRRYVRQGEERQVERPTGAGPKADFISVVTWRQTAEFVCKHFEKGSLINVVGSLQTRSYDDKNGVKHHITELVADEVNFCGREQRQQGQGDNYITQTQDASNGFAEVDAGDDLPF